MKSTHAIFFAVFTLIGVYLAYDSARSFMSRRAFLEGALRAQGRIVDYAYSNDSGGRGGVYRPKIQFQTLDGRTVVFESKSGSNPRVPIERPMKVLYHPDHPEDARDDSIMAFWGRPLITSAASLFIFMLLLGMTALTRVRPEGSGDGALGGDATYRPMVQWALLVMGVCFNALTIPFVLSVLSDNLGFPGAHPSNQIYLVLGILGLFEMAGLGFLVAFARSIFRRGRQPTTLCHVQSSEAVIGGVFRARLEIGAQAFKGAAEVRLTNLRVVTTHDNDGDTRRTVSEVLWCGTQKLDNPSGLASNGGNFYDVSLKVPAGAHPTDMAKDENFIWKLEMDALESPGGFHAEFPVILKMSETGDETEGSVGFKAPPIGMPEGFAESREG